MPEPRVAGAHIREANVGNSVQCPVVGCPTLIRRIGWGTPPIFSVSPCLRGVNRFLYIPGSLIRIYPSLSAVKLFAFFRVLRASV